MITLRKAGFTDCEMLHSMQIEAFTELFNKYKDYQTSPVTESVEVIQQKMQNSEYYFIILNQSEIIGAIRIIYRENSCRISPMYILPKYQNNGYSQFVLQEAEMLYPNVEHWDLDTIKQEKKLCHIYEKAGYSPNGKEEIIQENMSIIFYEKHNKTDKK